MSAFAASSGESANSAKPVPGCGGWRKNLGKALPQRAFPRAGRAHHGAYAGQSLGFFTEADRDGIDKVPEPIKAMYADPANGARLKAVQAVAQRHGVNINVVVLSYLLSQPLQTIPIFGASSPEQIEDSVKAAALSLSPQELAERHGE